ncbi:MAG: alpha/beta hydrolase, partial [Phycisphaerales bacterium JB065]
PSRDTPPPPTGAEEVWIDGPNGSRLHGWFLRAEGVAEGEAAPAVLHVHGNAGNIGDHLETCQWLPRIGVHVLMFDYRGYGKSDDDWLLRSNLVDDANSALDYLLTREDVDTERIGLFGWSLGGVIGLAVASEREEVDAVLAVASFSSWKRVAGDYVPIVGQLLIPGGFNAEDSVAKLGGRPLLLVHGTEDGIVRPYHSDRLRDAATKAGVEVELVTLDGYSHNDWMTSSEAVEAIRGFFWRELVE